METARELVFPDKVFIERVACKHNRGGADGEFDFCRLGGLGSRDRMKAAPNWLYWAERLRAIAQNGLTFARDSYDVQRYTQLREIAAEMIASGAGADPASVCHFLKQESGYATPKVDVRGVVFEGDKLLLVRESSDGKWTLPGGWADVAESPAENVAREVLEESGFRVRVDKLLAVYDRSRHPHAPAFPFHVYKLFFACTITGGSPARSSETTDVGFFAEHEIPELSETRVTAGQIQRIFEHHRHPNLPADFDPIVEP